MRATKVRLIFWPVFAAIVMFLLYTKRAELVVAEWMTYCGFAAGIVFSFMWFIDPSKPARLIALAAGLALGGGLFSTLVTDNLQTSYLILIGIFALSVIIGLWKS